MSAYKKVCPVCQKRFSPPHKKKQTKYCSIKCKAKGYVEKHLQWRKDNKEYVNSSRKKDQILLNRLDAHALRIEALEKLVDQIVHTLMR